MALLNKELNNEVETIFFMTDIKYAYLSFSAVQGSCPIWRNIDRLVPEVVKKSPGRKIYQIKKDTGAKGSGFFRQLSVIW